MNVFLKNYVSPKTFELCKSTLEPSIDLRSSISTRSEYINFTWKKKVYFFFSNIQLLLLSLFSNISDVIAAVFYGLLIGLGISIEFSFDIIGRLLRPIFLFFSHLLLNRKTRKKRAKQFNFACYSTGLKFFKLARKICGYPLLFPRKNSFSPKLKNIPIHHVSSKKLSDIPIHSINSLPYLAFKNFPSFFLIDSGCLYNIINEKDLNTFKEKYGLRLHYFKNKIKLNAHNDSPLRIKDNGVVLPLIIKNGKDSLVIRIPFLIEEGSSTTNIIGFNAIKNLNINFKRDYISCELTENNEYTPDLFSVVKKGNKLFSPFLPSTTEDIWVDTFNNFHDKDCKTQHAPELLCSSISKLNNENIRSDIIQMIGFDPLNVSQSTNKPFLHKSNMILPENCQSEYDECLIGIGQRLQFSDPEKTLSEIDDNVEGSSTFFRPIVFSSSEGNTLHIRLIDNDFNCLLCPKECGCIYVSKKSILKNIKNKVLPTLCVYKENICTFVFNPSFVQKQLENTYIISELITIINKKNIDNIIFGHPDHVDVYNHNNNLVDFLLFSLSQPLFSCTKKLHFPNFYIEESPPGGNDTKHDSKLDKNLSSSVKIDDLDRTDVLKPGSPISGTRVTDPGLTCNFLKPVYGTKPGSPISGTRVTDPGLTCNFLKPVYGTKPGSSISGTRVTDPGLTCNFLKPVYGTKPGSSISGTRVTDPGLNCDFQKPVYGIKPGSPISGTNDVMITDARLTCDSFKPFNGTVNNVYKPISHDAESLNTGWDNSSSTSCNPVYNYYQPGLLENTSCSELACSIVKPEPVANILINSSEDGVHVEKDQSLKHSAIGIPEHILSPPSVHFRVDTEGYTKDFQTMLSNSDPRLKNFLKILFQTFDQTVSKNKTDLGAFKNPNYQMSIKLREDEKIELPRHKPYSCHPYQRKATDRIIGQWLRCGLIENSTEKGHASRLLCVKKHLNPTDHSRIVNRLKTEHGIILNPSNQSELFHIDPDLLTDNEIDKCYRVVLDARAINKISEPIVPLMQSTQTTLLDLLFSLGPDSPKIKPQLPPKLKIKDLNSLRPPKRPNVETESYVHWEPEEICPNKTKSLYDYIQDKNNFPTEDDSPDELFMTSIDLRSAHHCVKLSQESKHLLNIITPNYQFFRFVQSPYGLSGISNYFNSALIDIFHDLIVANLVVVYADDLLIISRGSLQEHSALITEVIRRLHENGVKLSLGKSFFSTKSFKYLGFHFTKEGISLTEERVSGLINFARPMTQKALQRFLGSLQYIAPFYPYLSFDTNNLTDLLHKDRPYIWQDKHEECFNKIKTTIKNGLKLHYYRRGEKLQLFSDASNAAGGSVLFSYDPDNPKLIKPLLFLSQKFSKNQRNLYSALELECSNILFSLEKIRYLVDFVDIEVLTDAKCLIYLLKSSRVANSPRLTRITSKLSSFPVKYRISYTKPEVPGLKIADTLSRMHETTERNSFPRHLIKNISHNDVNHNLEGLYEFKDLLNFVKTNPDCVNFPQGLTANEHSELAFELISETKSIDFVHHNDFKFPQKDTVLFSISDKLDRENIILEQTQDPNWSEVLSLLRKNNLNVTENLIVDGYFLKEGLLFKKKDLSKDISSENSLLILPENLVHNIVSSFHIIYGHIGSTKLYEILKINYFHKNLKSIISNLVSKCHSCQLTKPLNYRKNPIYPFYKDRHPMETLSMDHFKVQRKNGFSYVLLVIDLFSRFLWLFPCRDEKASHVVKHLDGLFSIFGPPINIKSDNSKSLLRSKSVQSLLQKHGVRKTILTLPYHPLHNAHAERAIRNIRELIRVYQTSKRDLSWNEILTQINFIYNTTPRPHRLDNSTVLLSPFSKFFLRSPAEKILSPQNVILDKKFERNQKDVDSLVKLVNRYTISLQKKYENEHNKKARVLPIDIGDFVLYKDLQPPKAGEPALKNKPPFKNRLFIVKYIQGTKSIIEDLVSGITMAVSTVFLKKYNPREELFDHLPDTVKDHIGSQFQILPFSDRQNIIINLKKAGFDVEDLPLDDDIHPKPKIPKNIKKTLVQKSLKSSSNQTSETNAQTEFRVASNPNQQPISPTPSVINDNVSLISSFKSKASKIFSPSPWKNRLRIRKDKELK